MTTPNSVFTSRILTRSTAAGRPRQRATQELVSADVTVKAQRLPGVGWRYSVPADRGSQVMITLEDGGSRHLVLVDPALEEPLITVRLSDTDTDAGVAALLTGARFTPSTRGTRLHVNGCPHRGRVRGPFWCGGEWLHDHLGLDRAPA